MLKRVADGPAIVACNSCRQSPEVRVDGDGVSGGARLIEALRAVRASDPRYAGIAVQDMACLFACQDHCTVHLRARDKVGYVMGRFAPDADAARAILDYAVAYADSEHGRVAYSEWPEGVKGHFITRTPPPGFVVE
ncbi:metal-binding protein [Nostoc sp. 3335mG]|nr:metal-binding protein [Nostoc sp. 3335mG]